MRHYTRWFEAKPRPGAEQEWLLQGFVYLHIGLPADLACIVYADCAGTLHRLHDVWLSRKEQSDANANVYVVDIRGELPEQPPTTIGLLLRTNPDVALDTVDITEVGLYELTFQNVAVERMQQGPNIP